MKVQSVWENSYSHHFVAALFSVWIQLMQEYVSEEVRGLVGGVQQSLNAFVMLVPFALGLIMPDPEDFQIYATIGYASVGMAVLTFAAGVIRRGGEY